jgi:cell wall-associated NlpC family hydrolase
VAGVAAAVLGLVIPVAGADQLANLKAQAQQLSSEIQATGQQEAALSEHYDGALLQVNQTSAQVATAAGQVQKADTAAAAARQILVQEAVNAYVQDGVSGIQVGDGASLPGANAGILRAEYESTLATTQQDAMDAWRTASKLDQTARKQLEAQEAQQRQSLAVLAADRAAVIASQAHLEALYHQNQGQIAVVVAQIQAAQLAAERRAAAQRAAQLQAEQAAQQAAQLAARQSGSGGGSAGPVGASPTSFGPLPPLSRGAAGALQAAMTRLGDPYVWAAAGPNAFDCSGLVMWSYAQVGISLPHFSGAQYADTVHIPMSALQPGDLVFPANPGDHVAMYAGGGMIVEAPDSGNVVHEVPMGSWFVFASRVV